MRSLVISAFLLPALALSQGSGHTAAELIAGVRAAKPQGGVYARLRMEHQPAGGGRAVVLQVQVKRRTTSDGAAESLYQVLFPKERKGEGLLLRVKDGRVAGFACASGQAARPLKAAERAEGVFGTALAIDDVVADFLDWSSHEIIGREKLGGAPCAVVESRPSKSARQKAVVWIDESRLVAMKIEMHTADGRLARTIATNRVVRGSTGYFVPADLAVTDHASGAVTQVEGVRSQPGVVFTDADFAEAALRTITVPADPPPKP